MALPVRAQLQYWGIVALILVLLLWFLGNVLLPFVLGSAIAYFVDPVADRLERAGFSRMAATAIISVISIFVFVVMILLVVPTLISQTIGLIETLPELASQLQAFMAERFPSLLDANSTARHTLASIGDAS